MSAYAWSDRPTIEADRLARATVPSVAWPWGRTLVSLLIAGAIWPLAHFGTGVAAVAFLALLGLLVPTFRQVRRLRHQQEQAQIARADFEPVPWNATCVADWAAQHAPEAASTLETARTSAVGLLRGDLVYAQLGHALADLAAREQRLSFQEAVLA